MQTRYFYLLRFTLALSDMFLVNICFFLAYYLSSKYGNFIEPAIYHENILTCSIIWLLSCSFFKLYSEQTVYKLESIYRATWKSIAVHGVLFLTFIFLSSNSGFPQHLIASFYLLLIFSFLLSRFTGTALEEYLTANFKIRKTVAILEMNQGGLKLAAYLEKQNSFNFVGFLGEEGFYVDKNGDLMPAASEHFKTAAHSGIKEVYVSLSPDRMGDVKNLLNAAEKQCLRLKFVPDLSSGTAHFNIEHFGGFPVLSARAEPLENIENRVKKRFFDVFFSLTVVIFILSWLYPLLAIIIKSQSKGPVLFKQLRSGRDNKPFYCYKFRSMRMNNDSDKKQASMHDDRITPIGRFMRKTSLDELPQFFNVLQGKMSVLGPRPHMLSHTEEYRALIDQYMVRQFLKPGISGWAQVNGFRGETREPALMEKRVEHDIWYMENWSVMLDIRIIFMTVINIFKGEENAY